MKKILLFVFAAILCACSGSTSSPEATIKSYVSDVISIKENFKIPTKRKELENIDPKLQKKCDELIKYYYFGEGKELDEKKQTQFGVMQLMGIGAMQPKSFKIDGSETIDNDARVQVTITSDDGSTRVTDYKLIKTNGEWKINLRN